MKILLFGEIADIVGSPVIEIKRSADTNEMMQYLITQYPALTNRNFQLAINKEVVTSMLPLKDEDEIALLSPFAGG